MAGSTIRRRASRPRSTDINAARKPRVGELRQRFSLGSEAVYRVCRVERGFIEVEVVQAPGLPAGRRFRFAPRAVAEMGIIATAPKPDAAREPEESAREPEESARGER